MDRLCEDYVTQSLRFGVLGLGGSNRNDYLINICKFVFYYFLLLECWKQVKDSTFSHLSD